MGTEPSLTPIDDAPCLAYNLVKISLVQGVVVGSSGSEERLCPT